jgi:molybdate/tungstate transport system substrate-binding protein
MKRFIFLFGWMILGWIGFNGCTNQPGSKGSEGKDQLLVIFHAGSMSVPLKQMIDAFHELNPDVKVLTESAGSRESARKISELGKRCDLMVSADYQVISDLMMPEYATWNLGFATNEMVLAYNKKSRYRNEISPDNWTEIVLRDRLRVGRSEPESDPCGYRTVLTLKLADIHYKFDKFSNRVLNMSARHIRPKETDLLALLETGALDYIFIYRSVAEQHQLKYILLPDEINLKEPTLAWFYQKATVRLRGKKTGEWVEMQGEPMIYSFTIPVNAPNPDLALTFARFMMDPEMGMKILAFAGQPPLTPAFSSQPEALPDVLRKFVSP